jgi:hypothetical protein
VHYLTLLHYICIQPVYTQFNNPEQALLHSQSQAALNNKYKERSASDPATKSAHLHDKTARNALQSLENRFHKSAQPITAAPGVDTSQWPLRNYALITLDATSALKSCTGRTKALRNNTQKPAVDMTIHSAHGNQEGFKDMLRLLLLSGEFDDVLNEVNTTREQQSNGRQYNYNTKFVGSLSEIEQIHESNKQANKLAGGQRSESEVVEAINADVHDLPQDIDDLEEFMCG